MLGEYSEFAADQVSAVRFHPEDEHPFRSKFERDRDRIL